MRFDGSTTVNGRCFLCERPYEGGEYCTFMHMDFSPDFPHSLHGPKTVCDSCAAELAESVGYVPVAHLEGARGEARTNLERADALQAKIDEGIEGLFKLFSDRMEASVAPSTAKPRVRATKPRGTDS